MRILIIIPAFNEEKNINNVVQNLILNCPDYDYLIVNDCSLDQTAKICRENGYNYLSLPSNLGIGGAVQAGYIYADENDYDITVQIDGDGQHDPIYIKEMLEIMETQKNDMVIGSRFIECKGFQTSFLRRVGIKLIQGVIYLCCGVKITDTTSGYRLCSKELTKFYAQNYAQDYPEPEAIVAAVLNGYKVQEIPVIMHERKEGTSSINFTKSIYYMIKVSLALIIYRMSIKKRGS